MKSMTLNLRSNNAARAAKKKLSQPTHMIRELHCLRIHNDGRFCDAADMAAYGPKSYSVAILPMTC